MSQNSWTKQEPRPERALGRGPLREPFNGTTPTAQVRSRRSQGC